MFLSHLLPYDPADKKQNRLIRSLKEYQLLLVAAEQAMESFSKKEYNKFDPIVGENSCQIRAIKVALIASNISFNIESLKEKIHTCKKNINTFVESESLFSTDFSLNDFFDFFDADIPLHEDAAFLIKSFILSKAKILYDRGETIKFLKRGKVSTKLLRSLGDVSRDFVDDLERKLRQQVSKKSKQFILELSKCPILFEEKMTSIIDKFSITYKGIDCTPFYWMTKVILFKAFASNIPIIVLAEQLAEDLDYITVEKTTLIFYPTSSGYKRVLGDLPSSDEPALVFNVVSCRKMQDFSHKSAWEKELTEHDIIDLVLAYNASHPQYPDPTKESLVNVIGDKSYFYHLNRAKEWGCHVENPHRFILTHIYCDRIQNATFSDLHI